MRLTRSSPVGRGLVTVAVIALLFAGMYSPSGAAVNEGTVTGGLRTGGGSSSAPRSGSPVQVASNAFCYPAIRLVGTYSVNVERALGLNDGRPLPSYMSTKSRAAVTEFASRSLALSKIAPSAVLAIELRRLSVELKQSRLPIDVVRAEAAFGATGYPILGHICPSVTMIMTPTNPLGGFNSE